MADLDLVQATNASGSAGDEDVVLSYSSNVTAGSTLIAIVFSDDAMFGTVSVSDDVNAGNWTDGGGVDGTGTTNRAVNCFYFANAAAGATQVTSTTTNNGTATPSLHIFEVEGDLAPVDPEGTANITNSSAPSNVASTTTTASSFRVVGSRASSIPSAQTVTGFTANGSHDANRNAAFYLENDTTTGARDVSLSGGTSGTDWSVVHVAFEVSGAPADTSLPPINLLANPKMRNLLNR